ncbi:unnamed protein product, partial [marine sediment metagenome]
QALLYPLTFPFLPPVNKVEKDHKYAAGRLIGTLVAPPPQGIPKTGQTVSYRDGDDGDLEKGYPVTPPWLVDNEDGTITDKATGLMWVKDPINNPGAPFAGITNWYNAIDRCNTLVFATYDDWRLPNKKELLSIVDFGRFNMAIDPIFPNCGTYYWLSTTRADITSNAWRIYFHTGQTLSFLKGNATGTYARPVRLGVPAD